MNTTHKTLRSLFFAFLNCIVFSVFSSSASAQAILTRDGGAFSMFNGQDISAWNQIGNANWYPITNGVASNQGSGLLVSKFPFTDYQIEFNYWIDSNTQLSIFTHCNDVNNISKETALAINLSDSSSQGYGPGSIVGLKRALPIPSVYNRWNKASISSIGNQITVIVNGITTVNNLNYQQFVSGPFAVQFSGSDLRITNFSATIPGRW